MDPPKSEPNRAARKSFTSILGFISKKITAGMLDPEAVIATSEITKSSCRCFTSLNMTFKRRLSPEPAEGFRRRGLGHDRLTTQPNEPDKTYSVDHDRVNDVVAAAKFAFRW
jgi:hypothetical protein